MRPYRTVRPCVLGCRFRHRRRHLCRFEALLLINRLHRMQKLRWPKRQCPQTQQAATVASATKDAKNRMTANVASATKHAETENHKLQHPQTPQSQRPMQIRRHKRRHKPQRPQTPQSNRPQMLRRPQTTQKIRPQMLRRPQRTQKIRRLKPHRLQTQSQPCSEQKLVCG